jgi:O-antigen/teichoic acid export membrane protein
VTDRSSTGGPSLPLDDGIAGELEPHLREADPAAPPPTRRFNLRGRSLRQHTARGVVINTAFLVGLSGLGLFRGFVLAAFISAEDYGVWGILVVSLGTILWLKQVGIGDKYIQQDDPDQELAFQRAFTMEAMVTGIFMVLLAVSLPLFAWVYGEWQIIPPGLCILLLLPSGVLQAPLWVYYRNLDFFKLRALQSIDPVVGFVVAVGMAAAGAGYWSLAGGLLAGGWSAALAAVIVSPYKLRFRYDKGTLREYATFSWPLFVSSGSSLVIAQSAVIATNARLGLAATGAVALASSITSFTQRVDGLVTGTLYPAICAVRDKMDLLHESFVKSNRLALMWAMPFGLALTLFSDDLVHFLLGEKWRPVVILLQIYGLTAAVGHVAFNWDAFMRATAQTKPIAVASVASMVTFLAVGLPLLFAYGLKGLAYGAAAQMLAHLAVRAFYLRRLFAGFSLFRQLVRAVVPTIPAVGVILLVRLAQSGPRSATAAAAELIAYGLITAALTWVFERKLLREAATYLRPRAMAAPAA